MKNNKVTLQIVIDANDGDKSYEFYVSDIPMFSFAKGQTLELANIKWQAGNILYPNMAEWGTMEEYLELRDSEVTIKAVQYEFDPKCGWVITLQCDVGLLY